MSEGESVPVATPRKSKFKKMLLVFLAVVVVGIAAERISYHNRFPYGSSHCCILGVDGALQAYAREHGGRFPSGGGCPEASLSLLYSNYIDAYTLRGKSVSLQRVEHALNANGKLGPESCGWHYIEGLTLADDPRVAIVWDKVGLGHNGEILKNGAHEVIFVGNAREFIPSTNWAEFLKNQEELIAHRTQEATRGIPSLVASIRLPTGQVITNWEGTYDLSTTHISQGFTGHGSESGNNLELVRYRFVPEDAEITWVLTLGEKNLRSKPVSFTVKNGRATPSSVVFEMEKY
jgi:hypothetical protein